MKKKLNILLIDDDDDNNFINRIIIEEAGVNASIHSVISVLEAIQYLQSGANPDLIFVDINMPILSGWDFMEQYNSLPLKNDKIIVMLTSSVNLSDERKAQSFKEITEYKNKPLTTSTLNEILKTYF